MIATVVGLLLGALVAGAAWVASQDMLAVDALSRTNYRGAPIVTSAGVLVPVTVVAVAALDLLAERAGQRHWAWSDGLGTVVVAVVGFGLLGLFDDVVGVGQSGGFRGHLRALAHGRLTSGSLKLLGGALLGLVVATGAPVAGSASAVALLRDGAIVALAANLANLLDRAPGRVVKATTAAFAVTAAVARAPYMFGPACAVGAGLGLLPADLRERCMLGDAGANPLGAACGVAVLLATPSAAWRWSLAVVLLGLNLASEVVSFSTVIDGVAPLRWLDRAGSLRDR